MADANVSAPAGGRRRRILLLTGVVLVAAGSAVAIAPVAGQSPASGLEPFYRQQVTWATCADYPSTPSTVPGNPDVPGESMKDVECATVKVPKDYRSPDGETLDITVSRHRATDAAKRQGVVLLNPGGPGGSGESVVAVGTEPKR